VKKKKNTRCNLYYNTLPSMFMSVSITAKLQRQNISFNSQFTANDYMLLLERQ